MGFPDALNRSSGGSVRLTDFTSGVGCGELVMGLVEVWVMGVVAGVEMVVVGLTVVRVVIVVSGCFVVNAEVDKVGVMSKELALSLGLHAKIPIKTVININKTISRIANIFLLSFMTNTSFRI